MSKKIPPRVIRFLEWFCPPSLLEGIEGDLLEQFEEDCHTLGEKKARGRLTWHALKFFRPGILLRNRFSNPLTQTMMIRNYFVIAKRNMMKRKLYTFINAFGLSVGIAFCALIYLYIQDERSFDQFHADKELIYRLEIRTYNTWEKNPENPYSTHAWVQLAVRDAVKSDLAEVELSTRFTPDDQGIFRYGETFFNETITYVDADFFKMFSFPLRAGNRDKLFKDKSEIAITPEIARKYFGDEDPMGKTIVLDIDGEKDFTIAAIIEKPPSNSSLDFAVLVPEENRRNYDRNILSWSNYNTPTFVKVFPGTDMKNFSANLDKLVEKHMGKNAERYNKENGVSIPAGVKQYEYVYTVLPEIHMKKAIWWHKVSDPQYAWILGCIAVMILVIASINYISLALTTSASRRIEVGIRKVVGAHRHQLIYQFGFESLLLSLVSLAFGIGLALLFLPSFNQFTGKAIEMTIVTLAPVLTFSAAITLALGIAAGGYPALFLSAFRPAVVLKGRFTSRVQAGFTRPLVVIQFICSAFLIISSVIMHRQMKFVTTMDLGYNKEQVLVIPTQQGYNDQSDNMVSRYRNRLNQEPDVISVAGVSSSFAQGYSRSGYKIRGENKSSFIYCVDPFYLPTLGIELVAGRNFDPQIPSDSNSIIVNEALVRDMKWTDPLDEYLNWREDTVGLGAHVIGVVKDYHFQTLEENIEPMLLAINPEHVGHMTSILVKIIPGDISGVKDMLQKGWRDISPDKPFECNFLDQDVARQYEAYERWMNIMTLSTCFAILISCMGLFGLSGINAANRTKEIGIRKVMGAGLVNIFIMLNKQYVMLAVIAFAIGMPVSWYIMQKWLAGFKYTIPIGWELFVISMVAGLIIALATVSYHAIRTSLLNPADTLKYE